MTKQYAVEELASIFYGELQHRFDFSTCRTFAQVVIEKGLVKPSPADAKGGLVPLDEHKLTKHIESYYNAHPFKDLRDKELSISICSKFGTAPSKDVERVESDEVDIVNLLWEIKAVMSNGDYSPMPTLDSKSVVKVAKKIMSKFSPPQAISKLLKGEK